MTEFINVSDKVKPKNQEKGVHILGNGRNCDFLKNRTSER